MQAVTDGSRTAQGCSKRSSFSPAQPWRLLHPPALSLPRQPLRPGTHLVPSKAAGEKEPEAYPQGRTVRRIRSTTSVRAAELVRRPGPVEDFDELRTLLADVFSILLNIRGV